MINLDSSYHDRYDAVLRDVAEVNDEERDLCAFWPAIGAQFQAGEGILAIGRAVNGWGSTRFKATELTDASKRRDVMDTAREYKRDSECPLSWVVTREGKEDDYNTRRSQFWMVLKSLTRKLEGRDTDQWSSRLAWSNLYKVAPKEKGNPSGELKTSQRQVSGVELLQEEIRQMKARAVVFLTGHGWAGHFLRRMNVEWAVEERDGSAVQAGVVENVPFVVSRHPQGKGRQRWVDETFGLMQEIGAA